MSKKSKLERKAGLNKKNLVSIVVIVVLVLVVVFVSYLPKGAEAKKIAEQLNLGDKYLTELQYEQAEAAYLAVIKIDPKNADAYLKLAETYLTQGEYNKAIEILESALEELSEDAVDVREKLERARKMKEEAEVTPTAIPTPEPTAIPTPEPTEVPSPQSMVEQLDFDKSDGLLWPVTGDIIIPYSPDQEVYYYTVDMFSTSEAIVISAEVGTEVLAAAKGVVVGIEEDERIGTTVTLALGNNISLVYGQLDVADLNEGDVVEAGECLGTIADPTRYYIIEGSNLYFQVLEDGMSIDPTELLKDE